MSKRILITSTDLMMVQFLLPHIDTLYRNGYVIDIACSDVGNRIDEIRQKTNGVVNKLHIVRSVRNPFSFKNVKGYRDMKKIIIENNYDYIWTNEPVMGIVTRLATRSKRKKKLLKVLYMAHGFHFYKGAPWINWLLFYPVEWLASFWTDCLVTINREDFEFSQRLHAKKCEYIHGIGINTDRLNQKSGTDIRKELDLKDNDFLILSIGELNKNKNQKVIIKALSQINNSNIHYILCGKGQEEHALRTLCQDLHLNNNVHFLGYRTDIADICSQSDVFVMPTYREGLGLAALEAMYCSLPVIGSNNRGLKDIVIHNHSGFLCESDDYISFALSIGDMFKHPNKIIQFGAMGKKIAQPYEMENVKLEVLNLFASME